MWRKQLKTATSSLPNPSVSDQGQAVDTSRRWTLRASLDLLAVLMVIVTGSVALSRLLASNQLPGRLTSARDKRAEPLADFECPACAQFAFDTLPTIERDYVADGKVKLVLWHKPLRQHIRAVAAASAAECAGESGQFWAMHDLLFANQGQLDDTGLKKLVLGLGIPVAVPGCSQLDRHGMRRLVRYAGYSRSPTEEQRRPMGPPP